MFAALLGMSPLLRPLARYEPPTGSGEAEPVPFMVPAPRECPSPPETPSGVNPHRLISVVLEVLDGRRPVTQLSGLLADRALRAVRLRVRPHTTTLRRVHTYCPTTRAVEIAATVSRGTRVLAVAARAELHGQAWQLATFDIL